MQPVLKLNRLKVLRCKECPRVFTSQQKLFEHRKVHIHMFSAYVLLQRATVYKCRKCDLLFPQMRQMRMHELMHIQQNVPENKISHNINDNIERPFKCEHCDACYVLESTLISHSVLHEPFPNICECGVGFYKTKDLKSHKRLVHPKPTTWQPKINYHGPKSKKEVVVQRNKSPEPSENSEVNSDVKSSDEPEWEPENSKTVVKPRLKAKLKVKSAKKNRTSTPIELHDAILKNDLGEDVLIVQNENNLFSCPKCDKEFLHKAKVIKHYRIHTKRRYQCQLCPKNYCNTTYLKHHMYEHTGEEPRKFICDYCDKGFPVKPKLTLHILDHTGYRPYKCEECDKSYRQQVALRFHMNLHNFKKFLCQYCKKAFSNVNSKNNHERIHSNFRPFKCQYCVKTFNDPSSLKRHHRTHTGDKCYPCESCPMRFTDVSGLIAHRRIHKGIRTEKCKICDYKTFTRAALKKHVNAVHEKIKDFECAICLKRFAHNNALINHIKSVHNKVKRFDCKKCSHRTFSKQTMKKHVWARHSNIKPKLECEECGKMFKCNTYLKRHINYVHKNLKPRFECHDCGISEEKMLYLRNHIIVKHGTPFYCKCKELFSSQYDLRQHMIEGCIEKLKKSKKERPSSMGSMKFKGYDVKIEY